MSKPTAKQTTWLLWFGSRSRFHNKVTFIAEHSVPGENLLLEILHSNILQPQRYFFDVQHPQSRFTQIGNREHHNCPLTSRQLPDEAYCFPGIIHTVGHAVPLGLRAFEITLLSHHQPSKDTEPVGLNIYKLRASHLRGRVPTLDIANKLWLDCRSEEENLESAASALTHLPTGHGGKRASNVSREVFVLRWHWGNLHTPKLLCN